MSDPSKYRRFAMLARSELKQLSEGGMHVGAHTLSHPVLSESTIESAWAEIVESKTALEGVLGKVVWALAYPFGDAASVTKRELALAERAKYQCAFLNCGGRWGAETSRFSIPRIHVGAGMTMGEFEAHLSGFHDSLRAWWDGSQSV